MKENIIKKHLKNVYWGAIVGIPILIIALGELWPRQPLAIIIAFISIGLYGVAAKLVSELIFVKEELDITIENIKESNDLVNDINKNMNDGKINILKGTFKEFKETLKSKKIEGIDGQVKSIFYRTDTSAVVFEEETLITRKIKIRTINHIAQALTGIGIFGTFLGIVRGLGSLDLTNSETMQKGIAVLIDGVKLSFNTSLYGILLSIVIIFALKICSDGIMESSYRLVDILDEKIPVYVEENTTDNIVEELKKQRAIHEKLSTDLAEEMGKKFSASLEENINNLSGNLEELIENMKEEFSKSLNSSSESNMDMLNKNLTPVLERLDVTMESISKHQENSSEKFIEEMLGSLKETVSISTQGEADKLKNSMDVIADKNSEMITTFTEAMEKMQSLVQTQENLITNSTSSAQTMSSATTNMNDLQRELQDVILGLKDVNKNNGASLDNISWNLELIKESAEKQLEINKDLDKMLNKSTSVAIMQEETIKTYNNLGKRFENDLNSMKKSIENMTNNMSIYKTAIEGVSNESLKITEKLNSSYREAANNLNKANENINGTLNSLEKNVLTNVDGIVKNVRETSRELKVNHEKMSELTENMRTFASAEKESQNLWVSYKGTFEKLNETINEGVENYTTEIAKSTNEILSEYDNNIAEAINSLRKTVEELTEYSETIAESAEILAEKKERELV